MADERIDAARQIFEGADDLGQAYDDEIVFPAETIVDRGPDFEFFPGWTGTAVLVLAHENQSVVSWGLDLTDGTVIVGGEVGGHDEPTSVVYCADAATFAALRRWDLGLLRTEPLVQAQAPEIDEATLAMLRRDWTEVTSTSGWPTAEVLRFERGGTRLSVWCDEEQTDWWISGPEAEVAAILETLADLEPDAEFWSDDEVGDALLS